MTEQFTGNGLTGEECNAVLFSRTYDRKTKTYTWQAKHRYGGVLATAQGQSSDDAFQECRETAGAEMAARSNAFWRVPPHTVKLYYRPTSEQES